MFLIYLSIIGITSFFIIFGYINQLNLYEEEEYEKLQALASSLAINIDGDVHNKLMEDHPWKDDITSTDENAQYFEIHSMLRKVQEQNKLNTPLYTLFRQNQSILPYYIDHKTILKNFTPTGHFSHIRMESVCFGAMHVFGARNRTHSVGATLEQKCQYISLFVASNMS